MTLQKKGYDRKFLVGDLALGIFDGIDSALWCYGFAAIIFTGVLGIYLPLGLPILLFGWALLSIVIALTSRAPVHMIAIDEQAVVIIGSIALLMIARFGDQAASPRGLATLLAIMVSVSLMAAIGFFLAGRFHLSRLLELLPYPVICGFMAGIGWLLLDAGVMVALDRPISFNLWADLRANPRLGDNWLKLTSCLAGGLFLVIFTNRVQRSWALPTASASILLLFFAGAWLVGAEVGGLREAGWIFNIRLPQGGAPGYLLALSPADIDTAFLVSVIPQMLVVVFLTLLAASMNLSTMTSLNPEANLKSADEFAGLGGGNLLCALVACPPGYTDAPASILYEGFGARTRWMPLASSAVCLLVAVSGGWFINYTPKVLIGATIFLFAIQLFYDWMYANVRHFSATDYAIVCIILFTVIGFGFMQGILLGLLLTVLVFVLRYSMISAIQDQFSLIDQRSSVERSLAEVALLERHGGEALIYTLRGYLFFGTANAVRDTLRDSILNGRYSLLLLDLRRVTGIDISALNAFAQLRQVCELRGIRLLFACQDRAMQQRLLQAEVVNRDERELMLFEHADFALEQMEEILLRKYGQQAGKGLIRRYLYDLLGDVGKVEALLKAMIRTECVAGDCLFRQGDPDSGFYLLESGYLSATIDTGRGVSQRVKKFSPGSVIGELSSYTADGARTASVHADTRAVLYYLNPDSLADPSIVHELVARTLGARMEYMNRRLMWELM